MSTDVLLDGQYQIMNVKTDLFLMANASLGKDVQTTLDRKEAGVSEFIQWT